jgi:hypothetical protein
MFMVKVGTKENSPQRLALDLIGGTENAKQKMVTSSRPGYSVVPFLCALCVFAVNLFNFAIAT